VITLEGRVFKIKLEDLPSGTIRVTINGEKRLVSIVEETASALILEIDEQLVTVERPPALLPAKEKGVSQTSALEGVLVSPLPGLVVSIEVREGDEVDAGAPLLTIEAMKMESIIRAERHAKISEIMVKMGEAVRKGQLLMKYG